MAILRDIRDYIRLTNNTRLLPIAVVAAILAAFALSRRLRDLQQSGLLELSELGDVTSAIMVGVYTVTAALFLPVFALDMAAGAHFGFFMGVVWVQVAATTAAAVGFLLGRSVLRGLAEYLLSRNPNLVAIDDAVAREGWKIVFLTRLSPVFPFGVLNAFFGSTAVPFPSYLAATFCGMIPGTCMYVYAGRMASDIARSGEAASWPIWAAKITGLAATVAVTVVVTRIAQQRLGSRVTR